jgi:hypothetical protein
MTLQTSGTISLKDIRNEFAPSTNLYKLSVYYRNGLFVPDTAANAGIPTSGEISIGDFYGGDATPAGPPGPPGGGGGEGFPP